MKREVLFIGDIVEFHGKYGIHSGLVIDNTCKTGWFDVLTGEEVVKWPGSRLHKVNSGSTNGDTQQVKNDDRKERWLR